MLPKFEEAGISVRKFIDAEEVVLLFPETEIHKVNEFLKFMTKGKVEQLKKHKAELKAEARRLKEEKALRKKEEREKKKLDKQ